MADPESGLPPLSSGSSEDPEEARALSERAYAVYSAIAEAMPLEGRDYRVLLKGRGNGRVSVSLEPMNDFGRAFCVRAREFIMTAFGVGRASPAAKEEEKVQEEDVEQGF